MESSGGGGDDDNNNNGLGNSGNGNSGGIGAGGMNSGASASDLLDNLAKDQLLFVFGGWATYYSTGGYGSSWMPGGSGGGFSGMSGDAFENFVMDVFNSTQANVTYIGQASGNGGTGGVASPGDGGGGGDATHWYSGIANLWNSIRLPDYASLNVAIAIPTPYTGTAVGWNITASLDRYGHFYFSPIGVGVGKSAGRASGSLTANWLNQSTQPSEQQLNNFLTGHGVNLGGGYIFGGGESWSPGNGTATGIGFYTPQVGISYNYTPSSLNWPTSITW
jgi:hypothetical protein